MSGIFNRHSEPKTGRRATPDDMRTVSPEEWASIIEKRDQRAPRNLTQIREALRREDPWRLGQLERNVKFFRRRMAKIGLNPEDLRWLL